MQITQRRSTPARAATAAIAAGLAVLSVASPSDAHAAQTPVAPGDQIDAVAGDTQETCTLGYTFTDPTNSTTYGITAGHCNHNMASSHVRDRTTGAVGNFVLTVAEPDIFNGDDYGLINFGNNTPAPAVNGLPITDIGSPSSQTPLCHTGIQTQTTCGQLGRRLTGTQYTTSGIGQSLPGDSGGPVWQASERGTATLVGIWLGERITGNGARYGRFAALPEILSGMATKMKMM